MYAKARGLTAGRAPGEDGRRSLREGGGDFHALKYRITNALHRVKTAGWGVWVVALLLYASLALLLQPDVEELFEEESLDLREWVVEVRFFSFLMDCIAVKREKEKKRWGERVKERKKREKVIKDNKHQNPIDRKDKRKT